MTDAQQTFISFTPVRGRQRNPPAPVQPATVVAVMMEHDDDKTQLMPSGSTWILSAADASIGDMVVTPKKVITIGRQTGCDIVIPDRYVSRRHAEVFVRDAQLFVRDLQSTHGTLVNGEPVTECALRAGDEIRLDKAVFAVQQLGGAAQTAERDGATDAGDKTVMRSLDEVAASLDAAAAGGKAPPSAEADAPAREAPPPEASPPEVASSGAPSPKIAAEEAPATNREGVAEPVAGKEAVSEPAPPQEAAATPEGEPRRSKNWWDPQDAGPMGTRLVRVQDGVEEMQAQLAPQMETDRPMLVGISPAFRDQQFELHAGKMIVGKKTDADIRLDDECVSDVHAQIVGEGARWKVVNILSANGTFVNGKKIQAAYLRSGDVVRFGTVDLQFVDGSRGGRGRGGGGAGASPRMRRVGYLALGLLVLLAILALAFFAY
jgi:pSer/pThr/pTyr-binding forkhead associated (FHA) protein